jgi:hypothetical protein
VIRATLGASILEELSNEKIAVAVEDALRLNTAGLAVRVFIGVQFETQTVRQSDRAGRPGKPPWDPAARGLQE